MKKKGYISYYGLGYLAGITDAIIITGSYFNRSSFNAEHVFYASVFQSGVDIFVTPDASDRELFRSDFPKTRHQSLRKGIYRRRIEQIDACFFGSLLEQKGESKRSQGIEDLKLFICDLLVAMESHSCLLGIQRMPNVNGLEQLLHEELLSSVRNLLSTFRTESTQTPIPRFVISTADIKRFEEVIQTPSFSAYKQAHDELDSTSYSESKAMSKIIRTGREFVSKNASLAKLEQTAVSVLTITPKIIDAVFGKLPGVLAEAFGNSGVRILDERRRVVVYDCHKWIDTIIIPQFLKMLDRSQRAEPKTENA